MGGLLLGRTDFHAQPWYTTNAGSPRLIRGAISISTVLIGLSKEGSLTRRELLFSLSMMQCNAAKASQIFYPSWTSPPWRLDKYLRGNRLLISKEVRLHVLLTISIHIQ